MMKNIIIQDESTKRHFGFIEEFSGICAQGNSKEEVKNKLSKGYENYLKYIFRINKLK